MQEDKQVLIGDNLQEDNLTEEIIPEPRNPIVLLSSGPHEKFDSSYTEIGESFTGRTHRPCSDPLSNPSDDTGSLKRCGDFLYRRLSRLSRHLSIIGQTCRFHRKLLLSSTLVMISSSGCLIFFPLHLENVSRHGTSDGYAACLTASTITTLLFLFNCLILEVRSRRQGGFSDSVLRPLISWKNVLRVGFCLGLSVLTIFYSWEDDKVPCNFQDPLLGLVIIFAIVTHAVSRWRNVGLKRTFALSTIAAGVFVSVDYPLVDHHRCRGYYYRNQPGDPWTWKVHLVWTLAFVVSIWLSTVAAFFLESSVPVPKVKHSRLYDLEYNAVKLRVIKASINNGRGENGEEMSNVECYPNTLKSYRYSPYVNFHLSLISNAVLWFSIATWAFITSLFWTEFIPGFGKGVNVEKLPERLMIGFRLSLTTGSSWFLVFSLFIFCHSFTYLIVLTRSPIVAISVAMLGFPVIGLWWSFFQIQYANSLFIWMPVFSGELICALLGLNLILGGCYYLIKYEILKPAKVKNTVPIGVYQV